MGQRRRKLGQSIAEYALCITVVVAALLSMQLYVRRNLQARYRQPVQYLFSNLEQSTGKNFSDQYDPYYRQSEIRQQYNSTIIIPYLSVNEVVNRTGWQSVGPPE